jgi:hypothetical protein
VVRMTSLILTVTSTIILGLQNLNVWTGIAFSLVAVVTAVNTLEPFFAWRSRWVLMEEAQYKFYRLRDELTYYIAAKEPDQLDESRLRDMFDEYQKIWDQLSSVGWSIGERPRRDDDLERWLPRPVSLTSRAGCTNRGRRKDTPGNALSW